jgi:hypothetical protein
LPTRLPGDRQADAKSTQRLDAIEQLANDLCRMVSHPGFGGIRDDEVFERKSATKMCQIRRTNNVPKDDGLTTEYIAGSSEVDKAMAARRGFKAKLRLGDAARLDDLERKSLSAF